MNSKRLGLAVLCAVVVCLSVPFAMADSLALGSGFNYAVVVGGGAKDFVMNNNPMWTGNIGIGSGTAFTSTGPVQGGINGTINFADALVANGCASGISGPANCTINNTVLNGTPQTAQNAAEIADALNAAAVVSGSYSGGTPVNLNTTNTITVSGGTTHQYLVGSNFTIGGSGLTINGGPGDLVVFNVMGNAKFQGPITLNGIDSDHVLWNILSSGANVSSSGHGPVYGDLIDMNGVFNEDGTPVFGRWFGGMDNGDYRCVSGCGFYAPSDAPTPEPGTLALAGTGILGIAGVLRRKKRS
jgi:hypothetical protein